MASIIPGYEYDIFISYRQKDNKYDGWVTEFVTNLKKELEATFKEDVSVYFDINPHDGLLETHDVDTSLKEKLRCLVFIPIISRTYCDPKSFAWEHEFKAFVEQASEDQFGLKIKLPNGNIANRMIPIQIHDLYPEDKTLIEKELGGVLRAIEFIYKEPGVNKPLTANDNEKKNLNNTTYRIQINKVANAINEVIRSLTGINTTQTGRESQQDHRKSDLKETIERKDLTGAQLNNRKSKKWIIFLLSVVLGIAGLFVVFKIIEGGKRKNDIANLDKSIAVLPFANDSPDKENEYFCNGMMDEILNQLQKISDLKVKSRTSVEKYRNTDKDIKVIGHELGVSMIMEGSVRKIGDDLRIAAQLIDAKSGDHLWSEVYDGKFTREIFNFQSGVAKKVATSLKAVIKPEEKARIETKPTSDMRAFDLCLKAGEMWDNALYKDDSTWARNSKIMLNLYNQALKIDPLYTGALSGKASLFNWLGRYDSAMIYYKKVLEIDALDSHTWMGIGMIYQFSNKPDSAYYYFKKGLEHGANDPWDYTLMGQHLLYYMNDVIGALKYYQKGYDAQGGKSAALEWNTMIIFGMIGDYEKAQKYTYKALSQRSECEYIYDYNFLLYNQGKYNEALQFLDSVCSVNACEAYCLASKFYIYTIQKDFAKAEQYYNKYLNAGKIGNVNDTISLVFLASLYKETGRKKEAFSILNEVIRNVEKQLKHMGGWGYMQTKWLLTAAYAILDKNEKVLQYLSELEKTGFLQGSFNLKTFPGFDNLRNDPEFKAIVKRIEDKNAAIRKEVEEMRQRGEITL